MGLLSIFFFKVFCLYFSLFLLFYFIVSIALQPYNYKGSQYPLWFRFSIRHVNELKESRTHCHYLSLQKRGSLPIARGRDIRSFHRADVSQRIHYNAYKSDAANKSTSNQSKHLLRRFEQEVNRQPCLPSLAQLLSERNAV